MSTVGPVNWDSFGEKAKKAAESAAAETNRELAGELHAMTRLTAEEVEALAPTLADKGKLAELMAIVKSAETHNAKVARIVGDAEKFGEIVLRMSQWVAKVAVL
jgi:hypothetical protein